MSGVASRQNLRLLLALALVRAGAAALLHPTVRCNDGHATPSASRLDRRDALRAVAAALPAYALCGLPHRAAALVKGSAPPPKLAGPKERKCKSIDECEALGEAERAAKDEGADVSIERTVGGDRYRDISVGDGTSAKAGDYVELRYRVMRLGTKARDGLSGEGQTIFSLGFGEDDDKEGDTLPVQLAGESLVAGVKDAVIGMQPGGRRRVLVRPERGWRRLDGSCAEGSKSISIDQADKRTSSQDGNLVFKADIGAAIENENACQNKVSLPQPRTYGAKARFGRRFDESLLVELDLIKFSDGKAVAVAGGGGSVTDYDPKIERCRQNPFASGCDDGKPVD